MDSSEPENQKHKQFTQLNDQADQVSFQISMDFAHSENKVSAAEGH
jgi:hypothetical protein